jgi:hypothetical protein
LLPGGIGIDGGDSVGHGAATAKRHAEVMDRIGCKGDAGAIAFFEDALHPEGESGFIFGRHGEWILYRVPEKRLIAARCFMPGQRRRIPSRRNG